MRDERGFTLLEMMVAVAVGVIVLASVYGVYAGIVRARDRVEGGNATAHQARVVFDRLGRELRGAYPATGHAPPFAGGIDRNSGHAFLRFTTTASTPEGGLRGGIRAVQYELTPGEPPPNAGVLQRSEGLAFLGAPPAERAYRMLAGVNGFKTRFYNGNNWQDEWLESPGKQPQAVELTLTLRTEGETVSFVSSFELPAVERLP